MRLAQAGQPGHKNHRKRADTINLKRNGGQLRVIARRLHTEKKGIRIFGIAESSRKGASRSALAGVVIRRDLVIDGMAFGSVTVSGDDATETILNLYRSMDRDDVVCIMLAGLVISMYNIIDSERLYNETGVPVIAVTFEESQGLEASIEGRFPDSKVKMALYARLGARQRITLKTGKDVFIQCWGTDQRKAVAILNSFTRQGSVPEPIRIARLAARAVASAML